MPTYSTTIQGDAAAPPAPVTIANATLAVTGTFFQATQPVSLASTTITGSVAVTGTFFQATQPVSLASTTITGTVASTQSGTWTIQPGNTANTTPWLSTINQGGNSATVTASNALKVDGSAVTQPVSGTITANIGTTNGLALDASVTGLQVAQSSTTTGQKGALDFGAVTTAAPTYVTGQSNPLSLMTTGALRTDNSSWLGSTAPTVGSKTSANSVPVVIASDQGNVPVSQATASNLNAQVVGTVASGAADSGNPVKVGGVFNTTQPTLTNGQRGDAQLDANAQLIVSGPGSYKATYMASVLGLASAATATDIFTIIGSATKTVRILKIGISGLCTAGTRADIQVIKRSAADTGGTSTTPTIVPLDSSSAAGTAVVRAYTANPTALGAAVGTIVTMKLDIPTAATTNGIMEQLIEFTDNAAGIALRGVAQQIAVNLNSVTIGGSSFDLYITWTEE